MINKKYSILNNNQINYLSYFTALVPAALITGPFLADLIVSISAIFFLYLSFKEKFNFFKNHWIIKLLILFCIYLSFKSLINNEEMYSLIRSLFYVRYVFFSLLVCYLYNLNPSFSKIFLKILTLTLIILATHAYLIHFINFDLLKMNFGKISLKQNFSIIYNQWNVPYDYRISGLFYDESILGSYVEKILPIYLGLIFLNQKSIKYYILAIIFFFLIIISGERSSIALSILFLVTFSLSYKSNIKEKFYFVTIFVLTIVLIFSNPNLKKRIVDNTIFSFTENKIQTSQNNELINKEKIKLNIFSLGHQGHFTSAYKIFLDNKYFGIGPRQFRNECRDYEVSSYSCNTHPHNTYLEILSETGIFSFLIVLSVFLLISIFSIKHFFLKFIGNRKGIFNDLEVCLLASILLSLWPFSPSGSFFNNWMSIIYYFPVGLLLWQRSILKKNLK